MTNIFKNLKRFFIIQISTIFFISIFFTPAIFSNKTQKNSKNEETIKLNPKGFIWPIPGYTRISSPFGKRVSPTTGASSTHSGIDIPAPPGTKFIAVHDGKITFRQFLGAGGYTITLSFDKYKVSYCHCNPQFIVEVGEEVKQGQVIRRSWPQKCL